MDGSCTDKEKYKVCEFGADNVAEKARKREMKLYVITANTYDGWGGDISLFGIYEDEAKAKKRQVEIEEKYKDSALTEVDLNSDCEIYLDGYEE